MDAPGSGRAAAMAGSIRSALAISGADEPVLAMVAAALEAAMAPRTHALDDDHHPAFLHPGRSVLVLIRDVGRTDAPTLAAGALLESRDPELAADPADIARVLGAERASLLGEVPGPGAERLAERLDHLRHEHLRTPTVPLAALVDEAREIWLPLAERTAPVLARRYRHWVRTFGRNP